MSMNGAPVADKRRLRKPVPAYRALSGYLRDATLSEQIKVAGKVLAGRLGRRSPKVFAIGMNKAGTSSLHQLFVDWGYLSYHGVRWRSGHNGWLLDGFDCFSDGPPDDFRELDARYPGSRFILNVRDFDTWVLSRLKHIARDKVKRPGEVFPLDWDTTEHSIELWLQYRDRHHAEVLEHFGDRPRDLLVVNFIRDPDADRKVARFLGRPAAREKPWSNAAGGRGEAGEHEQMLDAVLARNGLSRSEARRDLIVMGLGAGRLPRDTSELPEGGAC